MKRLAQILLACTVSTALQDLRPGAEWSMSDNDPAKIQWLDQVQAPPTKAEVVARIADCKSDETTRTSLKQQARLDVRNTSLTQAQRLQALLILLDYDR